MKAMGIAVLMAQAGMYVACDAMKYSPFLGLYTQIGLRDDIRRGHSTFMVEILELRTILKRAKGPRHLVLGDELCAGTESQSALSIVGAGVRELAKRHVPFIIATHIHELSSLPDVVDAVGVGAMHLSVEFTQEDGLVFERKLRAGTGPSANGLGGSSDTPQAAPQGGGSSGTPPATVSATRCTSGVCTWSPASTVGNLIGWSFPSSRAAKDGSALTWTKTPAGLCIPDSRYFLIPFCLYSWSLKNKKIRNIKAPILL